MRVERYFQQRADKFDALYSDKSKLSHLLNRIFRRPIFVRAQIAVDALAALPAGFSVLDVGCGSGRNSVLFAQAGAGKVVGIDFSERMLELARAFASSHEGGERCQFVLGDFLENQSADEYDAVVAVGVFDYVSDPVSFLRKMSQAARHVVIASFPGLSLVRMPLRKIRYAWRNCPVYFYRRRQLEAIVRDAGFTDFQLHPCGAYESGFVLVAKQPGPAR
jgi:SAM-dependent methyltransferase